MLTMDIKSNSSFPHHATPKQRKTGIFLLRDNFLRNSDRIFEKK